MSIEQRPVVIPSDIRGLDRLVGLREDTTPATVNCMAMAVAQALADADLHRASDELEGLTASIKRGTGLAYNDPRGFGGSFLIVLIRRHHHPF